ncbi:MAG TPA: protein translocase subunit SecF [Myxococcota bacterium]|nr:protein translocase subunit SecF [Myxococcota bacterium]HRY92457.1 protein translocase subunit SecF [Myxococcota bacterium]
MQLFDSKKLNIDFVGARPRRTFGVMSVVLVVACLGAAVTMHLTEGLNWGIDFAGGTVIDVAFTKEVDVGEVRTTVGGLGYDKAVIQRSGVGGQEGGASFIIRVERIAILSEADAEKLRTGLKGVFGERLGEMSFDKDTGDQLDLRFSAAVTEDEVRAALQGQAQALNKAELGDVNIRREGKDESHRYLVTLTGVAKQIEQALGEKFPDAGAQVRKVEFVGPQVGSKLRTDGILALVYALLGILVYIAFRFELKFAPGAIIALFHDASIVIGVFALLGLEFNLTFVAAVLTVIGYSINDTIVVYDRIRENIAKYRSEALEIVINKSINETLGRTVMTSLTTVLAILGLLFIGFGEIQDFAIAMTIGIVVGTYSSIYVASGLTLVFDGWAKKAKNA